jgi:hypothetical protein
MILVIVVTAENALESELESRMLRKEVNIMFDSYDQWRLQNPWDAGFYSEASAPEPDEIAECDICDNREEMFGEVDSHTLEDAGWYLGPTSTLCPDHNPDNEENN